MIHDATLKDHGGYSFQISNRSRIALCRFEVTRTEMPGLEWTFFRQTALLIEESLRVESRQSSTLRWR